MRRFRLTHATRSYPKHSAHRVRFFHQETKPYNVAVIGGGITGLTAAWRLCQDPKCQKITLYEKSSQLGGWLQSETADVDGGRVVFEYGPRTIRASDPAALPMLDLLFSLGMTEQLFLIDRRSPAALNRYIYYPNHLVRMPGPEPNSGPLSSMWRGLKTLLTEPLFEGAIGAFLKEPIRDARTDRQDESIGDFVSRRLSPKMADNLASAVFHGIFAGDIYKLSAQTILGAQHALEKKHDSVTAGIVENMQEKKRVVTADHLLATWSVQEQRSLGHFDRLRAVLKSMSVFALRDGISEIARVMAKKFQEHSHKIQVVTEADIKAIRREENHDITISLDKGKNRVTSQTFNRVIATAPPPELARLIEAGSTKDSQRPTGTISRLKEHNYAVNVMVVNLYYDAPNLIPHRGFGYLIPRSVSFDQNPERGLGVIFGSETSQPQDTAPGTKLTVMMGGHWWDGWAESDLPSPEEGIRMARSLLKRHLGIEAAPALARARLQRDAIPQFTVNHLTRMASLSRAVREDFDRRLTLAGNWYSMHGVGINDCVTQGYLAATWGVDSTEGVGPLLNTMSDLMEDQAGGIPTSSQRYLMMKYQEIKRA
ncbi:hypothetical protein UA08_03425 [Talaromyces atroroseus]|uniref:Protoporphyrinogen oxidase n=1 Tax=Talaromyces atroroseus TaxID=1441469 RepID=A0A225B6G0_TALAT|nr:hypothetical protein UA08_03425 [Talaromyces atroroseus]OKL61487.1 hypothetical protein UA08_03425 [Talaromyces atroroseus]